MKFLVHILTFLLLVVGALITYSTLLFAGIGVVTPILTISTLIGLIVLLINRRYGLFVMLIVSTAWLLRYFEHVSYLLMYDPFSLGRWILTLIPLALAIPIFLKALNSELVARNITLSKRQTLLTIPAFLAIGFLSFIHKPHVSEYNCWHYINPENSSEFGITFAITPDQKFSAVSDSDYLRQIVLNESMTYEGRKGYYTPETRVRVVTRFKRIASVEILGFRNTEINKVVEFDKPISLDTKRLKGDLSILQPDFSIGD